MSSTVMAAYTVVYRRPLGLTFQICVILLTVNFCLINKTNTYTGSENYQKCEIACICEGKERKLCLTLQDPVFLCGVMESLSVGRMESFSFVEWSSSLQPATESCCFM